MTSRSVRASPLSHWLTGNSTDVINMQIPGVNLNAVVDGKTLADHWQFWTVNVKYLESMTHDQFCAEFPNAAREIERATKIQNKLAEMVQERLETKL